MIGECLDRKFKSKVGNLYGNKKSSNQDCKKIYRTITRYKCKELPNGVDRAQFDELLAVMSKVRETIGKFTQTFRWSPPDLIKIAILHYQFESIHPFLDGNGRIGRLLVPLYIQSKGMLQKSCLYISDYIERNKDTYYDMLTRARTHNDMISWIKFFLEVVIETSKQQRKNLEV